MSSISAPPAVRWIVRTLEEAGYETWAVGGAVRDVLAGRASVDWDFATRARPREVRRTFRRTVPIGMEHGTVGVLARDGTLYEVTTFRKDVETFGRHAVVEYADTLDEDLSRRDFTINAVAWHPLRDEIHDPHAGAEDLEDGILRTVGHPAERFAEDYLRVLRALRFAGRFDLTVEASTWKALAGAVDHLRDLSPERVREELLKILSSDPRPSRSLGLYAASGAVDVLYPELAGLVRRPAPGGLGDTASGDAASAGPPGGPASTGLDAWTSALLAADALPPTRPLVRLGALLMDAVPEGPPATVADAADPGSARERAARAAMAVLTRLRFSNADTDRVVAMVRAGRDLPGADADGPALRRWLARVGREGVADAFRQAGARARVVDAASADAGRSRARAVAASARALRRELGRRPPLTVGELALDGRDLIGMGLRPGRRFGEILGALLDRVIEEPDLNDRDTLAELVRREVAPELFEARDGSGGAP